MPGGTFLPGERVDLVTIEEEHLEFIRDHENDPAIRRPMTLDRPSNLAQQREGFEDTYDDDSVPLLACVDDEPVGWIVLFRVDESAGHAEVAYWISPDHQGEGYGKEMVALMVEYALEERRLHRVRARALAKNIASRNLLEDLGFVEEGVQRDEKYVDGEYVDTHFFGILEGEWDGPEAV